MADLEKELIDLEKAVDDFRGRANVDVREITISDDVRVLQQKWNIEDIPALDPKFLDNLRAKKQKDYDNATKALDGTIAARLDELRADIGQRLTEARRLRSESERIDPAMKPEAFVNARLLDEILEDRAEKWLKEHENDQAAILQRYQTSDDRRDSAFVRLVEKVHGLTDEAPEADGVKQFTSPLRKAVRVRMEARVPASIRDVMTKIEAAETTHTKARASAFPSKDTINRAIGAIVGGKAS